MTYIRDKKTNAVMNNDFSQYNAILAMRRKNKENQSLKTEIEILKRQIAKINEILGINNNG